LVPEQDEAKPVLPEGGQFRSQLRPQTFGAWKEKDLRVVREMGGRESVTGALGHGEIRKDSDLKLMSGKNFLNEGGSISGNDAESHNNLLNWFRFLRITPRKVARIFILFLKTRGGDVADL
jgi:hypothetical protein